MRKQALKTNKIAIKLKLLSKKRRKKVWSINKKDYLCTRNQNNGAIAQLVEQRTENPCVPGSIPGGTTLKKSN